MLLLDLACVIICTSCKPCSGCLRLMVKRGDLVCVPTRQLRMRLRARIFFGLDAQLLAVIPLLRGVKRRQAEAGKRGVGVEIFDQQKIVELGEIVLCQG